MSLQDQYKIALANYNKYKGKKGAYVIAHNIIWVKKAFALFAL
jgi:hypothetical protein